MALNIPSTFGVLLTNIIKTIIILLLGFVVGKILGMGINKTLTVLSFDDYFKKLKKRKISVARGISSFTSLCVYILAVIIALAQLGITTILIKSIILLLIILILFALTISLITFVRHLIIWLNMTSLNKVKIGDRLKFGKIDGIVQRITIGHVLLKTDENDTYALPNSMLTNKKFTVERSEVVKTSDNKKKK